MLDNGFAFYDRLASDGVPDPVLFGVHVVPQGQGSAHLALARMEANASRALDAGLASRAPITPPPLYSDGGLAVTTPTYNTPIVAVNQKAFPYGGLDLARLFDGEQEVAANTGGRPPASFGMLLRDVAGKRVMASQVARSRVVPRVEPLRLLGHARISSASIGPVYAGPFSDLRASGTARAAGVTVRVDLRFTRDWIESTWHVTRARPRARETVDVLLPPGATLAAQIAGNAHFNRAALTVRLMPVHDEQEAAAAAARLSS